MFSAINSGKVLVLVFACVILYAGSCSGDQLKMLPRPVVLDGLKYSQQSSCLAFLALFSLLLGISLLIQHMNLSQFMVLVS